MVPLSWVGGLAVVYLFPESLESRLQRVNNFYGYQPPQALNPKNRRPYRLTQQARNGIIRLAVECGTRPVEIARAYGVSESTVYRIVGEASRQSVYRTVWKGWNK